ncbi:MAG TPA: efflux transporter periplasmic adaptor subunit, partial [Betaproteobacteria bacterium]|nr:efflux transporter periplasmic adaptor subunit [Betaproteobacteria bacterium]
MMKSVFLCCLALTLCTGAAADQPSVQVQTTPLRQMSFSKTLASYGMAIPSPIRQRSLSLPHAGQIARLYVSAGQTVKRGAPLLELHTDPVAFAHYRQARAAVQFARGELKRVQQLTAGHLATQSRLAAARKALTDAEAALAAQRRLGAGRGTETLKAPFDAVVTRLAAHAGERLPAGTNVLRLSPVGALSFQLGVEPADSAQVGIGMTVRIIPVFGSGPPVRATIRDIHGVVNPKTRLVDVIARVDGKTPRRLLPGMMVRGDIRLATRKHWGVPRSAVLRDSRGAYLYQVAQGRAKRVAVATGWIDGRFISVSGGLDPRLPVVVVG